MSRATTLRWLAIGAAVICCLLGAYVLRDSGIDDVGISYRYARHLADGHGLTWNAWEEPVEGYSNLSWVLLLALCHWVGADIEVASKILGLLFGLAALILVARLAQSVSESSEGAAGHAWLVPLLAALSPTWLMWMMSGLEIALYGFLLVTSILALTMQGRKATAVMALSLALLLLTRPEGIALACVYLGVVWFLSRLSDAPRSFRLLPPLLAVIGTAAAVTIFRVAYYGYPLPNTVYAKFSTLFPSAEAVGRWVLYAAPFLILWAVSARWWWKLKARVAMGTSIALILVQTVQILPVNPVMHFLHRYTIAFLPLLLLPLLFLLARLPSRIATTIVACAFALWLSQDWPGVWRYQEANAYMLERQKCVVENLEKLGSDIRIAMFDSGRVPFWTDLPALDMAGLCDRRIAHEGFAPTRVLEHASGAPDAIIVATIVTDKGRDYPFGYDRMILGQPRFVDRYDLWMICTGNKDDQGDESNRYRFYDYAIFLLAQ